LGGLSFTIFHIGKTRIPFVRAGIEHYRKKIQPYASLELTAIREEPLRKGSSPREIHRKERDRLKKAMDTRTTWVVLDENSKALGSEAFASLLQEWMIQRRSRVAFLIGGPIGLPTEIRERANLVLTLSPMTLSHEMTLLVLMEQLYRALAILNQLPYPK
jgi:23S rRNA (pseudouridine1915-N3)-methyltransferase